MFELFFKVYITTRHFADTILSLVYLQWSCSYSSLVSLTKTYLEEGKLFCGKFTVGKAPGINVARVASKRRQNSKVDDVMR